MDLDNKAKVDLDRVVSLIADLNIPADKIMLFGFSDSTGAYASNQALSLSRAKAVESQFIRRGMKPAIVRGYGSDLAVASNDSDEGQAQESARGDLDQEVTGPGRDQRCKGRESILFCRSRYT